MHKTGNAPGCRFTSRERWLTPALFALVGFVLGWLTRPTRRAETNIRSVEIVTSARATPSAAAPPKRTRLDDPNSLLKEWEGMDHAPASTSRDSEIGAWLTRMAADFPQQMMQLVLKEPHFGRRCAW